MSNLKSKERSFFQELKRRKVFSASAAYVVTAWVLIQVASVLEPAYNLPEWLTRAVTTILILLFPIAIVLAWEFDATRKGIQRTGDDLDRGLTAKPWFRRSLIGIISAMSLGSIFWVWNTGVLTDETFSKKDDDGFPKVVAVDSFKTFASDESEWLGDSVANLVRDNLSQSRYLTVVSLRRWQAIAKQTSPEDVLGMAMDAGVRYLVQGEIIGSRKGYVLTVRLTDAADGEQIDARTFEVTEDASLLERSTAVAQNMRALLKVPVDERVDVYAADFAADHPSAYRAFVSGLDYWINFDYSDAERMLRASLELQPDFAMARYYLAWVVAVQDRSTEAVQILNDAANAAELSGRDRQYLQAMKAYLERDIDRGEDLYKTIINDYPNDLEAQYLLAEIYMQKRDYDALLKQYERISELEPEVHVGWSGMAFTHVLRGNYEDAWPHIERFAELAPDNPNVYVLSGDFYRGEGELEKAAESYKTALIKGPDLQEAAVSLATTEYLLGDSNTALTTLKNIIEDEKAIARYRIEAVFAAGAILNSMGRFTEHIEYLDKLNNLFVDSKVFLAKAYADKALAMHWLNRPANEIFAVIDDAIAASPGVPTRYLFARGLVELRTGDYSAATKTAAEIKGFALPADNPDRTENKAANYLLARVALAQDNTTQSLELLSQMRSYDGYDYRLYDVLQAETLIAIGNRKAAIEVLESVVTHQDNVQTRLDLELDRQLARFQLIQLHLANADQEAAMPLIKQLKSHWNQSDKEFAPARQLFADTAKRGGLAGSASQSP